MPTELYVSTEEVNCYLQAVSNPKTAANWRLEADYIFKCMKDNMTEAVRGKYALGLTATPSSKESKALRQRIYRLRDKTK